MGAMRQTAIKALAAILAVAALGLLVWTGASAQEEDNIHYEEPSAEEIQLISDISTRDQLIADQENLLNAYRCLFDTDVDLVTGGCADPATVTPGPAPAEPTLSDIEVRDQLIADQEALLNTYRCQFDVDTELVPDGCPTRQDSEPTTQSTANTFTAISTGGNHTCGLRTDHTIKCWGWNKFNQTDAPGGTFTTISAGGNHSCGLRTDQTIKCWGRNNDGEADAPGGTFTAVSAGSFHSCGLRTDQTIKCWGWNWGGQLNAPNLRDDPFTAISAGTHHSCGLRADQTIECWGNNNSNQRDAPGGTFTAISAGGNHTCGLRTDQTIECWGWGVWIPLFNDPPHPPDPPGGTFTAISAGTGTSPYGESHSCGLRTDQTIECWGYNEDGQADAPEGTFTAISTGPFHSCGLRTDQTIECWGRNWGGQTNVPN